MEDRSNINTPLVVPDNIEEINSTPVSNSQSIMDDTIKGQAENEKERGFKEGLLDNSDNEPTHPQQ